MSLSLETLAEIEERSWHCDDRDLPACPHGREPVDRCDVCTGDDVRVLLGGIKADAKRIAELEALRRLDAQALKLLTAVAERVGQERDAARDENTRLKEQLVEALEVETSVLTRALNRLRDPDMGGKYVGIARDMLDAAHRAGVGRVAIAAARKVLGG